jgi:fluoroquinolone transport system ATP-binding protein
MERARWSPIAASGTAAPGDAAVFVADLWFAYPAGPDVLQGVDFVVPQGEVTGLVGASGAGKSTVLRVVTGTVDTPRGLVEVLGRPLASWGPELYARMGVAFELPTHYRKLTGRENLELFAGLQPGPTRPLDELLTEVGLADAADVRVAAYSKGMAVRLGLARALLADPALLLLDEPTSGLDRGNAERVAALVAGHRDRGGAVLLSTHDLWLAEQVADRVLVLDGGRITGRVTATELGGSSGPATIRVRTGPASQPVVHDFPLPDAVQDPAFLALLTRDDLLDVTTHAQPGRLVAQLAGRRDRPPDVAP